MIHLLTKAEDNENLKVVITKTEVGITKTEVADFLFINKYKSVIIEQTHWAITNNGFRSDSLYEKKIAEDLVFNDALPKSLTITQVACLKAKPKIA